ncbi:UNVERIFIED_CONTAM: hypothetical protein RMT77_019909 [Armadillidium vulgare]
MKESFLILLCLTFSFSVSFATEANVKEKEDKVSGASLIEKNKEIGERLSRQLKWFEPAKVIFSKVREQNESQQDLDDQGRFLKIIHNNNNGKTQLDMLLEVLTTAAKDLSHICEEIADKFEEFVINDEANILRNRVGADQLRNMLADFRSTVLIQANSAAASALAAVGGNGGLLGLGGGGGLLDGLLGRK